MNELPNVGRGGILLKQPKQEVRGQVLESNQAGFHSCGEVMEPLSACFLPQKWGEGTKVLSIKYQVI